MTNSVIRKSLRILVLHNDYQQAGGESLVCKREVELLESAGHTVELVWVNNDAIHGLVAKITAAFAAIFSLRSYRLVSREISRFKPDVIHVHNFFPRLSPSIFYAAKWQGVPSVLTLHNYRIACPTAVLMHAGEINETSLSNGPWWALRHRVYKNSCLGTFVLCLMITIHKRLGTWDKQVSHFICLSNFAKDKFISWGIAEDKISVKPNFAYPPNTSTIPPDEERKYAVAIGRLSPEKGFAELIASWPKDAFELKIIGAGQLSEIGVKRLPKNVTVMGQLPHADTQNILAGARALIVPSTCYEGFPLVIAEAFSLGIPVICRYIGPLNEIVQDKINGRIYNNDLVEALGYVDKQFESLSAAAYQKYSNNYSPETNLLALNRILNKVIGQHSNDS